MIAEENRKLLEKIRKEDEEEQKIFKSNSSEIIARER
jgi:hypothetical protein